MSTPFTDRAYTVWVRYHPEGDWELDFIANTEHSARTFADEVLETQDVESVAIRRHPLTFEKGEPL